MTVQAAQQQSLKQSTSYGANGIAALVQHRDLLWAWAVRTVRARYQQSLLGGAWAVIQPIAQALIFSLIFTRIVPISTGDVPYILFSYTALVPWTLFAGSMTDMFESLVMNMNLVSKIYFPREVLPVAAGLARLVDFVIAGAILVAMIALFPQVSLSATLLYLPLILLVQLALTIGLSWSTCDTMCRNTRFSRSSRRRSAALRITCLSLGGSTGFTT